MTAETMPLIGRRFPRGDAKAKAAGAVRYLSDTRVDGMLEAAVVRSPLPRARVTALDFGPALETPGVVCALGPDELGNVGAARAFPDSPAVQKVLTGEPMFVGDAVAAVVATDRATARAAAELVEVDYAELPPVLDPAVAATGEPLLYPQAPGNLAGPPIDLERGDADAALARAARVFTDEYHVPRQCAQTIEPMGCVCDWTDPDRLEVMTHLDNVFHLREQLAEMLAIPEETVRIRTPEALGATFGLKNGLLASFEPLCALLSRKAGAPVRLMLSAEENISTTVTRHSGTIRLTTGVDASGDLLARTADVLLDSGSSGFGYVVALSMAGKWATLYRTPHLRFHGRGVYTNHVPAGAYRGVGTAQLAAAMEAQIDDIARALGEDPVAYRMRHVMRAGDTLPKGTPVRAFGVEECVERGAAAIGWDDRPITPPGARYARGKGMAIGLHHSGFSGALPGIDERSHCRARLDADGTVVLEMAAVDKGQGALSTLCTVAADTLGAGLGQIRVERIDSDVTPFDLMGAEASRTTYVTGRAVEYAATALRTRLLDAASRHLECPPGALELDGGVRAPNGARIEFADLAADLAGETVTGDFTPEDADQLPTIGADFCEVEVDRLTGVVRVLRFVAAQDVGRAINVLGCEGQIEGGVHHGIGYALTEELIVEDGQPLNGDFAGYRVFMAPDMPEITAILVEHPDPEGGPFGAKGLGTGVIPAVAAAVCNAIRDAVGVRPTRLPVTPARLLDLMAGDGRTSH